MHPTITRGTAAAAADTTPSYGLGTYLGLAGTGTGLTAAIVAGILGDRSEQTLGVLVGAGVAAAFGVVTIAGRMLQAAIANRSPAAASAIAEALEALEGELGAVKTIADTAGRRSDSAAIRAGDALKAIARVEASTEDRELAGELELAYQGDADKQPSATYAFGTLQGAPLGDVDVDELDGDEEGDEPGPELVGVPADRRVDAPPAPDVGDGLAAAAAPAPTEEQSA